MCPLPLKSITLGCVLLAAAAQHARPQTGWPRGNTTLTDRVQASPLLVDLDGDRRLEIIVPSFDDKLYVYAHDGTTFGPGWPQLLGFGDGTIASVAVGDTDGDGASEIVVAGDNIESRRASLKIYSTSGTLEASLALDGVDEASAKATPCLINCQQYDSAGAPHPAEEILLRDGDGQLHIMFWNNGVYADRYVAGNSLFSTTTDSLQMDRFGAQPITTSISARHLDAQRTLFAAASNNNRIYRWISDSQLGAAWNLQSTVTLQLGGSFLNRIVGSIALADLDGDQLFDYIVGGLDGTVHAINGVSFQTLPGWPRPTLEGIVTSPAAADLDGDEQLEVLVGDNAGLLYAWHADGTSVNGWPVSLEGDVFGSPVIGELDGMPGLEVIAASLDGHISMWHADGTPVVGWPKRLNTELYATPALADVHGGGRFSLVVAGFNGQVFVFDLPRKSISPGDGWHQFRGGARRQGHQP